MTADGFLCSLESRGVSLLLDPSAPSGLRVRAPRGLMTPALADRIRQAAPALRPLLETKHAGAEGQTTRPIAQTALLGDPGAKPGFSGPVGRLLAQGQLGYPMNGELPHERLGQFSNPMRRQTPHAWLQESASIDTAEQIDEESVAQDQQAAVARLYLAWQAGALPDPETPIRIAPGTCVKSPSAWLAANLPRCWRLREKYGPCWHLPDPRRPLIDQTAPDLAEGLLALGRWWESVAGDSALSEETP